MEIKILDSAYIYNFSLDTEELRKNIKKKLDQQFISTLESWTLYFYFRYNNVNDIMIYLKSRSLTSEKTKEITIHLPFPNNQQADWGVNKSDHVYNDPSHLDHLKNFHRIHVEFNDYSNREDYISDCMIKSINYCFNEGFTINGMKVKTSSNILI